MTVGPALEDITPLFLSNTKPAGKPDAAGFIVNSFVGLPPVCFGTQSADGVPYIAFITFVELLISGAFCETFTSHLAIAFA